MLTVQPKISTNYSAQKAISFKSEDRSEDFYKEKVDYYKKQAQEFENLINEQDSPKSVRKIMKFFKVASEALLEGWAVAWGASKGAKILKSSFISGINSNFAKHTKDILSPIVSGFKSSGSKVGESISSIFGRIKGSKFITKIADKYSTVINKMNENPVGKYVVKGFEYIGKAFKYIGSLISKGFNKATASIKEAKPNEVYDKVAKVTSSTLGVGAGAAGAYNAATNVNKTDSNIELEEDYDFGEEE